MSPDVWKALFLGVYVFLLMLIAYERGRNAGVKDTERRWSEAVGRADEARRDRAHSYSSAAVEISDATNEWNKRALELSAHKRAVAGSSCRPAPDVKE